MAVWVDVKPATRSRVYRADVRAGSNSSDKPSATGTNATTEYCRQARRLRQQYAGDPALLHTRLRELSRRHDRANPSATQGTHKVSPVATLWDEEIPRGSSVPRNFSYAQGNAQSRDSDTEVTAVRVRRRLEDKAASDARFGRAVVDWFADQVAERVEGRLLHYSERVQMLKTAERLGISRFHANLIIAIAQHEDPTEVETGAAESSEKSGKWWIAALVVSIQAMIAWGVWGVLHGM